MHRPTLKEARRVKFKPRRFYFKNDESVFTYNPSIHLRSFRPPLPVYLSVSVSGSLSFSISVSVPHSPRCARHRCRGTAGSGSSARCRHRSAEWAATVCAPTFPRAPAPSAGRTAAPITCVQLKRVGQGIAAIPPTQVSYLGRKVRLNGCRLGQLHLLHLAQTRLAELLQRRPAR